MNALLAGTLVYSFAVSAPAGWKEVPASVCKRAYSADFDGKVFSKDGAQLIVRAHCYIKSHEPAK
jgi:hypothetical protein